MARQHEDQLVATPLDVRAGLAAELKRLVRDPSEWPLKDRRRFRNLLLDAVSSDAMPVAELLLRAYDDGMLRQLPDRSASRQVWDAAAARLAGDLQVQRFVEPGIARFVADAWTNALGPDPVPVARVATPRPVIAPRQQPRPTTGAPMPSTRPPTTAAQPSAASLKAYRQTNSLMLGMGVVFTGLVAFAFWDTNRRAERASESPAAATRPSTAAPTRQPVLPTPEPGRFDVQVPRVAASDAGTGSPASSPPTPAVAVAEASGIAPTPVSPAARDSARSTRDSAAPVVRAPVTVAPASPRTADDIVMHAGRVIEGRVLSVRQQTVIVKDGDSGLEFEIAKSDIDRIVTRDGRTMRFGDDNAPLLGDDGALAPISFAGRYRVRYAERWGAERAPCRDVARTFAPGTDLVLRHLRGAPMMKMEFLNGQSFNASVRSDGLFESGVDVSPVRGPSNSFVTVRVAGRISRSGAVQAVTRLTASAADGSVVCDLALTTTGDRVP